MLYRSVLFWAVQEHVYNITVPATCLPHTGFAGVWTPATHAELICHRTIHKHGAVVGETFQDNRAIVRELPQASFDTLHTHCAAIETGATPYRGNHRVYNCISAASHSLNQLGTMRSGVLLIPPIRNFMNRDRTSSGAMPLVRMGDHDHERLEFEVAADLLCYRSADLDFCTARSSSSCFTPVEAL